MTTRTKEGVTDSLRAKAGVTTEYFDFYRYQFASRETPYIWKTDTRDWIRRNWLLSPSSIAGHLLDEHFVGTFASNTTDYFVVDVDKKGDESDFRNRVEKVKTIFPGGTAIQSSSSGGVHYYIFLDDQYPGDEVRQLATARLSRFGVELRNGQYELFPQPNKGLRLPFGKDSHVLDIETFGWTTHSRNEDLFFVVNQTDRLAMEEVFDAEDYAVAEDRIQDANASMSSTCIENINIHSIVSTFSDGELSGFDHPIHLQCLWFLNHGLQESGTRYEVTTMLIVFLLKVVRMSPEQTFEILEAWYCNKTNGMSKDWQDNPGRVLGELGRRIKSIAGWSSRWLGLSADEARRVIALDLDFRASWFLFDLSKFLKTHADTDGTAFISQSLLYKMACCSHRNYRKRIATAIEHRFIDKIEAHVFRGNGKRGSATRYRTILTFDRKTQVYFEFPVAAAAILGEAEFVRKYRPYYWLTYVVRAEKGGSRNEQTQNLSQ